MIFYIFSSNSLGFSLSLIAIYSLSNLLDSISSLLGRFKLISSGMLKLDPLYMSNSSEEELDESMSYLGELAIDFFSDTKFITFSSNSSLSL